MTDITINVTSYVTSTNSVQQIMNCLKTQCPWINSIIYEPKQYGDGIAHNLKIVFPNNYNSLAIRIALAQC
jgi:hypothetical protein